MNVQRAKSTAGWLPQAIETLIKRQQGALFASGVRFVCNSLEAVCPEIAADFDIQKNGVSAAQVTSSTST